MKNALMGLDAILLHRAFFHLLYLLFAVVTVHACQRLVEQATQHIEPEERRAGLPRASLCIGCLVWALDVMGFLLYPWARLGEAQLMPALLALVLMLLIARVLVPMFATTQGMDRAWMAAGGLGLSILGVHLAVASALGRRPSGIHPAYLALGMGLAVAIGGGMALMHRSQQTRTPGPGGFRMVSWQVKGAAGLAVVVLHRVLDAGIPLEPRPGGAGMGILPALLVLVLFAVVVTVDQAFSGADQKRREVFDRALALLRSSTLPAGDEDGRRLCLVAARVEAILGAPSFTLQFQPIVALAPGHGGVRFEALLRAEHPDVGAIEPELFFLACERRGLAPMADRAVLREAVLASLPWAAQAPRCQGIAVNIGPRTLLEPDFLPWLQALLRGLPSHWLELEITEHALVAVSGRMREVLEALVALGVRTSLDDFGTGFSSLGLLPLLPLGGLKCDRSLLMGASSDPNRRVILEKICQMAAALGLGVTVEGIESPGDLDVVRACGATAGQGYFLARPLAPGAVPAWLGGHRALDGDRALPVPGVLAASLVGLGR